MWCGYFVRAQKPGMRKYFLNVFIYAIECLVKVFSNEWLKNGQPNFLTILKCVEANIGNCIQSPLSYKF